MHLQSQQSINSCKYFINSIPKTCFSDQLQLSVFIHLKHFLSVLIVIENTNLIKQYHTDLDNLVF